MVPACPALLPVTVVGSYPQPDWLIDRRMLSKDVPRATAYGTLKALAEGARIVRAELA
jgi:5-methyltetrahydropteroyltriglutamate--homocysteine methyltransferase